MAWLRAARSVAWMRRCCAGPTIFRLRRSPVKSSAEVQVGIGAEGGEFGVAGVDGVEHGGDVPAGEFDQLDVAEPGPQVDADGVLVVAAGRLAQGAAAVDPMVEPFADGDVGVFAVGVQDPPRVCFGGQWFAAGDGGGDEVADAGGAVRVVGQCEEGTDAVEFGVGLGLGGEPAPAQRPSSSVGGGREFALVLPDAVGRVPGAAGPSQLWGSCVRTGGRWPDRCSCTVCRWCRSTVPPVQLRWDGVVVDERSPSRRGQVRPYR